MPLVGPVVVSESGQLKLLREIEKLDAPTPGPTRPILRGDEMSGLSATLKSAAKNFEKRGDMCEYSPAAIYEIGCVLERLERDNASLLDALKAIVQTWESYLDSYRG